MANITNVPDYIMLVDTRHHQQPKGIGTPTTKVLSITAVHNNNKLADITMEKET